MPISKSQLEQILNGKARKLCSPEGDSMVNEMAGRVNTQSYDPDPSSYDMDSDEFDSMYLGSTAGNSGRDMYYDERTAANSKLPDVIKQSMLNERIDTSGLDPNRSVLDGLNLNQQPKRKPRPQVNEQLYAPKQQGGGIDYSIIKAIVNECIRENLSGLLTEGNNQLKTVVLKGGNISLVDNSGNVYAAKLEKIKDGSNK